MKKKTNLKTFEDLYNYTKENGRDATAILMREWVENGQQDDFMPGFTARAICKCAGMALDGIPKDKVSDITYLDTTWGWYFYWFMWGLI